MTRQQQIKAGKLWQVHREGSEEILCEGSRAKCFRYVQQHYGIRAYKRGEIRLGQVIWEKDENAAQHSLT